MTRLPWVGLRTEDSKMMKDFRGLGTKSRLRSEPSPGKWLFDLDLSPNRHSRAAESRAFPPKGHILPISTKPFRRTRRLISEIS
jgi:hypothetical protein